MSFRNIKFVIISLILVSLKVASLKKCDLSINHPKTEKSIQSLSSSHSNTIVARNEINSLKKTTLLSIIIPWFYFLSISLNMPSFPKYVNWCVNKGNTDVSSNSQKIYGDYAGLDSFCTFLSVNFIGCLSDTYGRKPFILFSTAGLGLSYLLSCFAPQFPHFFYIAGCLDGFTSSMFGQAQAYATDLSYHQQRLIQQSVNSPTSKKRETKSISEIIGRFQGLAIGIAYIIGIPVSNLLTKYGTYQSPIIASIVLCSISILLTIFFLPESLPIQYDTDGKPIKKPIQWHNANPLGAINMLGSRGYQLALSSIAYFFLNLAQTGTTIIWINYMSYRFGWSSHLAGSAFMVLGLMVIFIPKLLIKWFGSKVAVAVAMFIHALSLYTIGMAKSGKIIAYLGIPLLSIGVSAMPLCLGFLSEQVNQDESGALQGAADTVRAFSNMIGNPVMSRLFSHFLSQGKERSGGSLLVCSLLSMISCLLYSLMLSIRGIISIREKKKVETLSQSNLSMEIWGEELERE